MELKGTSKLMNSEDYKERLKVEYHQTKNRYEKLKKFNNRIRAAEMTRFEVERKEMPKHDCPSELLFSQQGAMEEYLRILELRAEIEGVEL